MTFNTGKRLRVKRGGGQLNDAIAGSLGHKANPAAARRGPKPRNQCRELRHLQSKRTVASGRHEHLPARAVLRSGSSVEEQINSKHLLAAVDQARNRLGCRLVTFIVQDDGYRRILRRRNGFEPDSCGAEPVREVETLEQSLESQMLGIVQPPDILDGNRGVANNAA